MSAPAPPAPEPRFVPEQTRLIVRGFLPPGAMPPPWHAHWRQPDSFAPAAQDHSVLTSASSCSPNALLLLQLPAYLLGLRRLKSGVLPPTPAAHWPALYPRV